MILCLLQVPEHWRALYIRSTCACKTARHCSGQKSPSDSCGFINGPGQTGIGGRGAFPAELQQRLRDTGHSNPSNLARGGGRGGARVSRGWHPARVSSLYKSLLQQAPPKTTDYNMKGWYGARLLRGIWLQTDGASSSSNIRRRFPQRSTTHHQRSNHEIDEGDLLLLYAQRAGDGHGSPLHSYHLRQFVQGSRRRSCSSSPSCWPPCVGGGWTLNRAHSSGEQNSRLCARELTNRTMSVLVGGQTTV